LRPEAIKVGFNQGVRFNSKELKIES